MKVFINKTGVFFTENNAAQHTKEINCDAYLGCVSYNDIQYHVVVMQSQLNLCKIPFNIYQIIEIEIVTLDYENHYICKILREHFEQTGMYYSDDIRILYKDFVIENDFDKNTFWWNQQLNGMQYCVFGYIRGNAISRRTFGFQGKRFFNRGCDQQGNVANQLYCQLFIELDELQKTNKNQENIILESTVVQSQITNIKNMKIINMIRGSLPLIFQQYSNMTRQPPVFINKKQLDIQTYFENIHYMIKDRTLVFVNLIDNKKDQQQLSQLLLQQYISYFKNAKVQYSTYHINMQQNGKIHQLNFAKVINDNQKYKVGLLLLTENHVYCHLDYHASVSKYGNSIIFDILQFLQINNYNIEDSIFRVNCMDSLDRTNSFITAYYQYILKQYTLSNSQYENIQQNQLDQGNIIALQYASTQAMKQDFALHGKRTCKGLFQDLLILIQRTYLNNLKDGQHQDAFKLIQNEYGSNDKLNVIQNSHFDDNYCVLDYYCVWIDFGVWQGVCLQRTDKMKNKKSTISLRSRSKMSEFRISGGTTGQHLLARICDATEITNNVVPLKTSRFADGELSTQFKKNLMSKDLYIVQSVCRPDVNASLVELLLAIQSAKLAGASKVTAIVPYLAYQRQDRKIQSGDPISAKLILDLIKVSGADRVITFDLHALQIQGFCSTRMPLEAIPGELIFLPYLHKLCLHEKYIIVAPDAGGIARCRVLMQMLGIDEIAFINKRRFAKNEVEVMNVIGSVLDKNVIIYDDICDTAGTLCKAAAALKSAGALRIVGVVTHAVLSNNSALELKQSAFEELLISDTIEVSSQALQMMQKVKVVSCAGILAGVAKCFNSGQSVVSFYNDYIKNIQPDTQFAYE